MKNLLILITFFTAIFVKAQNKIEYNVDLTKVKDDRVLVSIKTPSIKENEVKFYLPKMIPGTYKIADYGRFVVDFKPMDKKGNTLEFEKLNDNEWVIKKAKKMTEIQYWIDDYYDWEGEGAEIYPMAATNIEENKNYVLNTPGFFGYFEGMKDLPITLRVLKPNGFYGTTGLMRIDEMNTSLDSELKMANVEYDTYEVENYDRLIDSPLMYAAPDTAIVKVGDTDVLVGAFAPNAKINAKEIAETMKETLMAQKAYLRDQLPVDKYAFIFYFTDEPVTMYGALEHSYSSFYYMPEGAIDNYRQQLRDIAAHEFFHIITPLTIHSEQVHKFNFNEPEMSKHLWLYEGVTEYFAGNAQIRGGLISPEEYLDKLREKLITSQKYYNDSLPFTDLSKFTLDKYGDEYPNVYQKGALIGMCLDISLIKLSNGKTTLRDVVLDLSEKLGKDNYFEDEKLFSMITDMTYPEIGEFFNTYVEGPNKIPYSDFFENVGIKYIPKVMTEELTYGFSNHTIKLVEGGKLAIANEENLNTFGKKLGLKNDDVLLKLDGKEIPPIGPEIQEYINDIKSNLAEGKEFSVTILRDNQEVVLKAPNEMIPKENLYLLEIDPEATPQQIAAREVWLGN